MTDLIGRQIDNYRIEERIGDGGMGTVYRALDVVLGRQVALKVMHAHFARQPEFRERLQQEARIASQLDHPSIVKIHEFGEDPDGVLYIAMEYIRDGSVREHLSRFQEQGRNFPLTRALQTGIQIADALDYAHRRSIIHRDVKLGNIIFKRTQRAEEPRFAPFRAILTDFGLVQILSGDRITDMGVMMGTPAYMAPEQVQGEDLDGRSDLYSLGVVLYELITGRLPFNFQTLNEAIMTHMRGEMPQSVRVFRSDVPPLIDALLMKALAKDRESRFATGSVMADQLRSAMLALDDSPTQVIITPEDRDIFAAPAVMIEGFDLVIESGRETPMRRPMTQAVYTLGRSAENDIVLPIEGVSRYHAQLRGTETGWELRDLSGRGDTSVEGRRLRYQETVLLRPEQRVRIGPYEMYVDGPDLVGSGPISGAHVAGAAAAAVAGAALTDSESAPFRVFLARENLSVEPGRPTELNVEVVNQSDVDDRVRLRVAGLPEGWVTLPQRFESVPAGERVNLNVQIKPPRSRQAQGGRQRFRVELVSQRYPDAQIGASASLNIETFESFDINLSPNEVSLPDDVLVTVRNLGNASAEFGVEPRSDSDQIRFSGQRARIPLQAGEEVVIPIRLTAAQSRWFGSNDVLPFDVDVASSSGGVQTASGSATTKSLIPGWLTALALVLLLTTCFLASALIMFPPGGRNPGATATPTQVIVVPGVSPTVPGVAPSTPTIPSPLNDSDGDGVSNGQEAILGSDPNNIDSDADGVLDGQEAFQFGTNLLRPDTDSDGLTDLTETQSNCLNPLLWSTAGDNVSDGEKLALGVNPCLPLVTPTATATFPAIGPPPTRTPTRVVPPTWTPTTTPPSPFTPTPTPSSTPPAPATITPTPTTTLPAPVTDTPIPTPTNTVPAPATDTPTPTNTPPAPSTDTPTPTNTVPAPATDTPTPTNTVPAPATDTPAAPATDTPPASATATFTPPAP